MEKDTNIEKLLDAITRETRLSVGLREVVCPRSCWAVLLGRMFNPPRPGLHKDVVRDRLSKKEAMEFLRGFRLGFHLGAKTVYPGPQAIRLYAGDDFEPIPEKDSPGGGGGAIPDTQ